MGEGRSLMWVRALRYACALAAALAIGLPASALANTIHVTSPTDEVSTLNGCSLREAVIAANTDTGGPGTDCDPGAGDDTIELPDGHYVLTRTGAAENLADTGDLDLTDNVTIVGTGADSTLIDGNLTDRVFDNTNGTSELRDLTVENGKTADGDPGAAGIAGGSGTGATSLGGLGNGAPDSGGGIRNSATLTLTRVKVTGNTAGEGGAGGTGDTGGSGSAGSPGGNSFGGAGGNGANGGGIANEGGALTITDSEITLNLAGNGGRGGDGGSGGVGGDGSNGGPGGSSFGGTGGYGGSGGGLYHASGSLVVFGSTFANNRAGDGGHGGNGGNGASGGSGSAANGGGGGLSDGGGSNFGGGGGAIDAEAGTVELTDTTLSGNSAGDAGDGGDAGNGGAGGMGAGGFGAGGNASGGPGGPAGFGGGAVLSGSLSSLTRVAVVNNAAGQGADGGDAGNGGNGATGGTSLGAGGGGGGLNGGLDLNAGSSNLLNVTVGANQAGNGGNGGTAGSVGSGGIPTPATSGNGGQGGSDAGVLVGAGSAAFTHDTIARNTVGLGGSGATGGADGIQGGLVGQGGSATLRSSIVAYNTAEQCGGTFTDGGHNLSFPNDNTCPADVHGDPKVGVVANNGGLTPTMALGAGSAAIDAAGTGFPCPAADQRGVPRPKGAACDIGAFERAAPSATTGGASSITGVSAKLAGTANPDGLPTTYRFQFGKTTAYGSQTPGVGIGSGTAGVPAHATLTGLEPNTTYHYRLVVTNGDGTAFGADRTFKTLSVTATPPFTGAPIVSKKAEVKKKKAKIKVACPALAVTPCKGTLKLMVKVKKKGKKKTLRLGKATFTIAAGQTRTVTLKVSKKGLKLLKKRKKLKASARTRATDARGGTPVVKTGKVTLKPAKKKKKKK